MEMHFFILGHLIVYALCVCNSQLSANIHANLYRNEIREEFKKGTMKPLTYLKIYLVYPFIVSLLLFVPLEIIYWTFIWLL